MGGQRRALGPPAARRRARDGSAPHLLGGLEDDDAARGEGGRDLDRKGRGGEVPRRDARDDADGLHARVGEGLAVDRDGLAVDLVWRSGWGGWGGARTCELL